MVRKRGQIVGMAARLISGRGYPHPQTVAIRPLDDLTRTALCDQHA